MAQDEPGLRCDSDVVLVRRDGAQPRGTTSAFDRGDISLRAAVVRKLRAVYRDPVEIAEALGLPRREWLSGMMSRAFPPSCSGHPSALAPWARLFQ
jgi:hypothetical protein